MQKAESVSQPNLRLQARNRLKNRYEFQVVFQSDLRVVSRYFVLYYSPNENEYFRLGVVVSKRSVKSAVRRNTIKRLVKEIVRPQSSSVAGFDLVILARQSASSLRKEQYRPCIEQLLARFLNHLDEDLHG